MPRVLYLTSSVLYSVMGSWSIQKKRYHVVIPLLLHRYQYCICKSSMFNTTCASITLCTLCSVFVPSHKYSYGTLRIWNLNWKEPSISIENMLPLRWFYTLVNAHLCVLKLEASTYIHETRSIVTSATLAAAVRPEGRIIVGCAVYAQQCISKQYAIIASTVTYCMQ